MKLLIRWLILTLTILAISQVVPGIAVDGLAPALAFAAVLSVLNVAVKPVLVFLTLPLTVVSLGFFLLVINALLFELAGAVVRGMHVGSFWSAFLASLIVSLVSWAMPGSAGGWRGKRIVVVKRWGMRPPPPQRSGEDDSNVIDV